MYKYNMTLEVDVIVENNKYGTVYVKWSCSSAFATMISFIICFV